MASLLLPGPETVERDELSMSALCLAIMRDNLVYVTPAHHAHHWGRIVRIIMCTWACSGTRRCACAAASLQQPPTGREHSLHPSVPDHYR